jgi:hypothetical protein
MEANISYSNLDLKLNQKKLNFNRANMDLHVVGIEWSEDIKAYLKSLSFILLPVIGEIIESRVIASKLYQPNCHEIARQHFIALLNNVEIFGNENFSGYMELELRGEKKVIPWKEFDPNISNDLAMRIPQLEPKEVVDNNFKVADIHFTAFKISPELQKILLNKGFYYLDFPNKGREDKIHRVFTVQTSNLSETVKLFNIVYEFISIVGGFEGACFIETVDSFVRTKKHPIPPKVEKVVFESNDLVEY